MDGNGLGILSQGGDTHFLQRFALQTHDAYDAVAAMKFALEFQNPLVTGTITGGSAYPATNYSHLTINNPNVLLWALKPAEEGIGDGMVARVWNVSAQSAPLSLALAQPLNKARRVTHIETDVGPAVLTNGVLSATLNPQQLQTFKLQVAPQLRASIDAERVILSWPSHAASYALEAAANPGPPPPDWVPLTNSPQPAGEHLQITLQAAGSHQFFRLRQP